jgi:UDP-glucuronate 4-epimerase
MNILVTGGAGFIGHQVAKALVARGDSVVVADNLSNYYSVQLKRDRLAEIQDKVTVCNVDISNYEELEKIFKEHTFDKVCHLAAQAGVRYSIENPFTYERINCLGTLNVLELMREYDVKDLVFASSSSVYGGNTKVPFSESDTVDTPISLYAATKKYNELKAHVYHTLFGFNCFGLRFFTVYGPFGRPDMALFKFTKAILQNTPINIFNNGDHRRDFTYVTDIVDGVIRSIDRVNGYQIFNLGNSNTTQLMYFIECIEKTLGKKAIKNMLPMQPGDVHTTSADISKAKRLLGWEPKVRIEEGIQKFISWYKGYHKIGE